MVEKPAIIITKTLSDVAKDFDRWHTNIMKKILIIEDDKQLQKTYSEILAPDKYNVACVTDGHDGIIAAKNNKPDLIILDIMLPGGLNGFDVLEQLKRDRILKEIPVIISSNLDTEQKTAMNIGASGYFIKVDTPPQTLIGIIRKFLS